MPDSHLPQGPRRIVCLTEETTEWLYLLGEEQRIVGISGYTVRPARARAEKPRVSAFLSAKIDRILELRPDCVFGFSDLQADIAAELIRKGIQVTVFNQRSVAEIFSMMYQVAAMVGQSARGLALMHDMQQRLDVIARAAAALPLRPRVFFEEWDNPHISAIAWVSELLGIAGGDDCFPELACQSMGRDRIIADGAQIVQRYAAVAHGDGGHIQPPQSLHQGEARGLVDAHHMGGRHKPLARAQPDRFGLVDEIAHRHGEAAVSDEHCVARPLRTERGGGEGVFRHDGADGEHAPERLIQIELVGAGLGLEGCWHFPVTE